MLGLGLGMGVGNKAPLLPVSEFPSVADIRPGMVVLDSDGVVKQKVGDYLIPVPVTIIGSGPLANAPVASAGNQNMWYHSTDFGLCKCVSVLNNAGIDYVNCFRPSWLNLFDPSLAFCVDVIAYTKSGVGYGPLFTLGGGSSATRQLDIAHRGDTGLCQTNIGGAQVVTPSAVSLNTWHKYQLKNAPRSFKVDGTELTTGAAGTFISSEGLFVNSNAVGLGLDYFDGFVAVLRFYDASCQLVDALDFNTWDGTGTIKFKSGHSCTITDGAPNTPKGYSWVPWSLLQ